MRIINGSIRLTASDLSNHLACRHLTTLDLEVLRGKREPAGWAAPNLKVIQELGRRFERDYLEHLRSLDAPEGGRKLEVVDLSDIKDEVRLLAETRELMERGVDAIAQGALSDEQWFGKPDVLRRVQAPSSKWPWSYEVVDTKLARETKATTILQLSLYSELLKKVQEFAPENLYVVIPAPGGAFAEEKYRVEEYAAYYRYVKKRLLNAVASAIGENLASEDVANWRARSPASGSAQYALSFETFTPVMPPTYPEPVEHCSVCQWFLECDGQRRADDHLSLVAGIRRQQRDQFEAWNTATMVKLAALPIPLQERPRHGSKAGYEKVREQARVQVEGRTQNTLKYEPLPVANGAGLCRLPEPSPRDIFLDFEGDPFAGDNGLQYLFGFAEHSETGALRYEKRWALNRDEEKRGFEWLVDEIMARRAADPLMHVYHFGAYEPGTLKRLMGMYATREDEIDRLLRAGVLVDLHQVFKQGLRASVEEYSLKKLEAFYDFTRGTSLDDSRPAMRYIEHRLELGWGDAPFPEQIRATMEGYNADDCCSTAHLRDWLEQRRTELLQRGEAIERPIPGEEAPSEELDERQKRVATLVGQLTADVPTDPAKRTDEQQARWLLAQLLDWHRREDKSTYWEGFRLADLDGEDLLEERAGLAGLTFLLRLRTERQIPVDRYSFEKQETEARSGKPLCVSGDSFGTVEAIDPIARTVDIKKMKKTAEIHPKAVYVWERPLGVKDQRDSLFRLGEWVAANNMDVSGPYRAARDLLLRRPPRLNAGEKLEQRASETPENTASRIVLSMKDSVFAIQGPPGSGKTYTGARMICELARRGKKVGVTALSHKVIRNLLDMVVEAAREKDVEVRCLHRDRKGVESDGVSVAKENNEQALQALNSGRANVLGGVSWLWSCQAAAESVDVLFIDEAGQMSLADVLAVAQAAKKLVLLGDPQQLEQPLQGSHPDGAEKSALQHLLDGQKTIPPELGFLLPETFRLHPKICAYTSKIFYEERLQSDELAANRLLKGHPWLDGAGMWLLPVEHEGNRNSSAEEVEVVARIVETLLTPEVEWFYSKGRSTRLPANEILIVAPYNVQVTDLTARLPHIRVGTVDKFQGQQAAVVIYSMTTSSPADVPHGMEFLFSLNRFNVATSRAKVAVIVVGSPKLFEPECRTPRQMQLANALCAYREMATAIDPRII